jgi:TolB protein
MVLYQPAVGFVYFPVPVTPQGTYTLVATMPRTLTTIAFLKTGTTAQVPTPPGTYYLTVRLLDFSLPPPAQSDGHLTVQSSFAHTGLPDVDAAAFHNQGRLAFLWQRRLYVLDGKTGALHTLTQDPGAIDPAWAPDGSELAFLRVTDPQSSAGTLWLARPDGSQTYQVTWLPAPVTSFAWSPRSNTLVVTLAWNSGSGGQVWIVPTNGGAAYAVADDGVGAAWAPDGSQIAYSGPSKSDPASDALYTVPSAGGAATQRYVAAGAGIRVAGWWPDGRGLAFWRDPLHSASLAADGLPLYSLPLGSTPRELATTLPYVTWLAWSPGGHKVALVSGAGREVWANKALERCDALTGACTAIAQPPHAVAFDPAWTSRGTAVAFVRARALAINYSFGTGISALASWLASRTLWVQGGATAAPSPVEGAGVAAYQPMWSADGRRLMFEDGFNVWMIPAAGGHAVKIVGPFDPKLELHGYYGYVPFSSLLAWWQQ